VSYTRLSSYQVALAALLPKRGTGATAEALAAASTLPIALVRSGLDAMAAAGLVTFDAESGEYRNAGDPDA
jgi:DNA-binding IclR family transcriptional regulator